jgi:hypothetical protein
MQIRSTEFHKENKGEKQRESDIRNSGGKLMEKGRPVQQTP